MLIIVLGIGIGCDEYNLDKLCYYKIIIMIDVDVDGVYICILLLMFFYCQMLELIECGYVYIGLLLLYKIKQGKQELYLKDDLVLDSYLVSSVVENVLLVLVIGEFGIEGFVLEKLLLVYVVVFDFIECNVYCYDCNLFEVLVDFVLMDMDSLCNVGEGEGLDVLVKCFNQGSLGSLCFSLELQEVNEECFVVVLVICCYMGEEYIQVLLMLVFESGELCVIYQVFKLLYGLVCEGVMIFRGVKLIEVDSFVKVQNWLFEEVKCGCQIQ